MFSVAYNDLKIVMDLYVSLSASKLVDVMALLLGGRGCLKTFLIRLIFVLTAFVILLRLYKVL